MLQIKKRLSPINPFLVSSACPRRRCLQSWAIVAIIERVIVSVGECRSKSQDRERER